MMDSRQRAYNWNDICRLIWKDLGLLSEQDQRDKGEMRFVGEMVVPENANKTILKVNVYDKSFDDRTRDHSDKSDLPLL